MSAPTQREAVGRLRDLLAQIESGLPAKAEKLKVGEWLDEWLEKEARKRCRPRTWQSYRAIVEYHLKPGLGRIYLRKLSPANIRDYFDERSSKLSARSVQHHHAVLRRALRIAEEYGYVDRNVARVITPPQARSSEVKPLTPEQSQRFLAAARGDRLESLYRVAMATGLRQSELLGLGWSDVDLVDRTVRVNQTLQRYGGAFHLDTPKTDKSKRTLAIPEPLVAAFREQHDKQAFEKATAGPLWEGDEWGLVFTAPNGLPLLGSHVTRSFQKILRLEGLPVVRFHDLRHGVATFLLLAGVDLKVIQDVLGHSTIHTTASVYAHVMPELRREAADRIGDMLFGDKAAAGT